MTSIAVVVILILIIFALAEFAEKCGGPADGHDPVDSSVCGRDSRIADDPFVVHLRDFQ